MNIFIIKVRKGYVKLSANLPPPSGWEVNLSRGYPPAFDQASLTIHRYQINTPGWREALWKKSVFPKYTTRWPGQVSNPDLSNQTPAH